MNPSLLDPVMHLLVLLAVVSTVTFIGLVAAALWVFHNAKNWHGVGAALHVERLGFEVTAVRGNFEAFKRDTSDWMREIQDCNQQILRQLESIQRNGAKENPLEDRIREMKDEVEDALQALHSLPCYIDRDLHSKLLEELKSKEKP